MRRYDVGQILFHVAGIAAWGGFLTLVALLIVNLVQSVRAEPKIVACRSQQMEPLRYTLTDSVVCVPFPMRRDTLALQEAR